MFYVSKSIKIEIQVYTNSYIIWFAGSTDIHKLIIPKTFNIIPSLSRIQLVAQDSLNSFNFYFLSRKKVKIFYKQIQRFIYALFKHTLFSTTLGFHNILVLRGIGYQFLMRKKILLIQVGYSHLITSSYKFSDLIYFNAALNLLRIRTKNLVTLSMYLAAVKKLYKLNIYKGKGIRYLNEFVRVKSVKKKKAT